MPDVLSQLPPTRCPFASRNVTSTPGALCTVGAVDEHVVLVMNSLDVV